MSPDAAEIARAVEILRAGRLVAFPTETVYGLGADAANPDAVRRIFAAKGRPSDHPVIVHLASADSIGEWAREMPPAARMLAQAFWPGPLTMILPRTARVDDVVTGGQDSVGIRVPSHPVARALLRAFGGGVVAPSANRFGRISPTTAEHVRTELGDQVDLVLDGGASDVGIESAIVDLSGAQPTLLRPGMIGAARIEAVLGRRLGRSGATSPRASGTLDAHYAPVTPMALLASDALDHAALAAPTTAVLARRPAPADARVAIWSIAATDPVRYAHDLYASLRSLDAGRFARILVEQPPDEPEWAAVHDRLNRAAHGAGK